MTLWTPWLELLSLWLAMRNAVRKQKPTPKPLPPITAKTNQWYRWQCKACGGIMVWQDTPDNRSCGSAYVHCPRFDCRYRELVSVPLMKEIDELTAELLLVRLRK